MTTSWRTNLTTGHRCRANSDPVQVPGHQDDSPCSVAPSQAWSRAVVVAASRCGLRVRARTRARIPSEVRLAMSAGRVGSNSASNQLTMRV